MNSCPDNRYRQMLELYLLDLLSDKEREELELHLLECDACAQEALKSNEIFQHLMDSEEARSHTKNALTKKTDQPEAESETEKKTFLSRNRVWRLAIPFAAIAVFILIIFKIANFIPDTGVTARSNRLAVMPFLNLADFNDSGWLGKITSNLLITDLSESRRLQVIPDRYINDILRVMGMEESAVTDRQVALQVANTARARWLFMGSIQEVEPNYKLKFTLIDNLKGDTIAVKDISADRDEDLFALVDKLTLEVKNLLVDAKGRPDESDPPISKITTHSTEAYFYYLKGLDDYNKFYFEEAIDYFRKALSYDSTFAMVYYYLSVLQNPDIIQTALKYLNNSDQKGQYYIRSRSALLEGDTTRAISELVDMVGLYPDEKDGYYMLGLRRRYLHDFDGALRYYHKTIDIDPFYKLAYNQMAYLYNIIGENDSALWAINEYISLAPEEANPYDTRGEIYVYQGRIDEAIESFKVALTKKPDFQPSAIKLGHLSIHKRQYEEARKWYTWQPAIKDEFKRLWAELYLSNIWMHQGKLDSVILHLEKELDVINKLPETYEKTEVAVHYRLRKAIALSEKDISLATSEIKKILAIDDASFPVGVLPLLHVFVYFLTENGDLDQAEKVFKRFKLGPKGSKIERYNYYFASGCVELAKRDTKSAIRSFNMLTDLKLPWHDFIGRYMLARAYFEDGQYYQAITEIDDQQQYMNSQKIMYSPWNLKMYYYLGVAHEKSGSINQAIELFKGLISLSKNADNDILFLNDAKVRLRKLTG